MSKHESPTNARFWIDFSERVGFTAAYAGVSEAIVEVSDLNQVWAPIIMVGLNILKSLIAKKLNGTGGAVSPAPVVAIPVPTSSPTGVTENTSVTGG